jgi:hypothetical protein
MRTRVAAAIALAVVGCATETIDGPKQVTALALSPYAIQEECAKLAPGDRLEYTFSADAAVKFNVHYHDGPAIVEPISRAGIREDAGVFAPVLAQDYCLMWEAGAQPANLDYRIRIRRAAR